MLSGTLAVAGTSVLSNNPATAVCLPPPPQFRTISLPVTASLLDDTMKRYKPLGRSRVRTCSVERGAIHVAAARAAIQVLLVRENIGNAAEHAAPEKLVSAQSAFVLIRCGIFTQHRM